jgi:transposase
VSDSMRKQLVTLVNQGEQIKVVAQRLGIAYENAKAIVRTFKQEHRVVRRNGTKGRPKHRAKVKSVKTSKHPEPSQAQVMQESQPKMTVELK